MAQTAPLPGDQLDPAKMPGHWLLARMGKRVLRPGGLDLTRQMLAALDVTSDDDVVELAPGLGTTTRIVLERHPTTYVAVERDRAAAGLVTKLLHDEGQRCEIGTASKTGLPTESASVVFGEAMLTMQTAAQKVAIVREASRLLRPGGRYGIHELSLTPDDLDGTVKDTILKELSAVIRVGARPLTSSEWRAVLEAEGLEVTFEAVAPMHLLEPGRLLADEGVAGVARIAFNVIRTPAARRRILAMRRVFRAHAERLGAIALVARKPAEVH
ncbi:MAG: class I SAM-dependent methyltransferase [Myxococcota bacterium]